MKILVTGGTGMVGTQVLQQLEGRGVKVRALVRKQKAVLPKSVEPFVGDLIDPVSVEAALTGVDKPSWTAFDI